MKHSSTHSIFRTKILILCVIFLLGWQALSSQTQKTNLPTIYITTDNNVPITSKENYVSGRIRIVSSDPTELLDTITEIRGRGNSTWNLAKKPYRIKLDKKYPLLNMPADAKSWVLLANHADKTLMRNAVAFKISEIIGLEFSPSVRFVDLVLNNVFLGNYMLTDQVQVNKYRVNIDELTNEDTDSETITGGYLLEIDGFAAAEPVWFTSSQGLKITVKSPDEEEINTLQLDYIKNYINEFETRLFSSNFKDPNLGYRAKVDTASLINWYIGCELTGNSDSFWSTYIYKKRGVDKLFFGPMWDYDIAFNNDDRLGDATNKLMRNHAHNPRTWIERMYQDEWFQRAVLKRWNELVAAGLESTLLSYIESTSSLLSQSQSLNFSTNLWPILNTKVYREQYLFNTYDKGVNYLKQYISARISFLSDSFVQELTPIPSENFTVNEAAYYMIMNVNSNNVIDVSGGSLADDADLVLWEPISDDAGQLWKIIPSGNDTYRIVNKQSNLAIAGNGRGNNLKQKTIAENNSQKWKIVPVNTGNVYCLVNAASDYSMNNSGGGLANGTAVIEYDKNIDYNGTYYTVTSKNRQWYLQIAEIEENSKVNSIAANNINLSLYPNPVRDKLNLEFESSDNSLVSVEIYDLLGKNVFSSSYLTSTGRNSIQIMMQDAKSGIYMLVLSSEHGEKVTRKVIVDK